ncbi:MAG: SufD family Fe-S cluster assembly protein, partial [Nitrosopumilaceae archaeon]
MQNLALSTISVSHIDEISSSKNEPDWLKEYRKNSLSVYQKLPLETSPLYNKYTDANKMDPEQVSLTINSDKSVPEFLTNRLKELANETCIVQIGSNIHKINLPDELQKKGLVICSIDDALKNYNDIIQKTLESTNSKEDKYTALNNAAFNSGIFIYVPRNLILEKPIHIVSSLSVDGASTISRNVIVTEDNSKASIVQELYAPKTSHQQAYLELLNVSVGQNSQLDGTTLQIMDISAINFSTRKSNIAQDGKINWYLGLFGAMLSRYRIDYYLNGSGASANDSEVVFGNDNQSFDLSSNVNHEKPSTEAKVIEKSILKDKS